MTFNFLIFIYIVLKFYPFSYQCDMLFILLLSYFKKSIFYYEIGDIFTSLFINI